MDGSNTSRPTSAEGEGSEAGHTHTAPSQDPALVTTQVEGTEAHGPTFILQPGAVVEDEAQEPVEEEDQPDDHDVAVADDTERGYDDGDGEDVPVDHAEEHEENDEHDEDDEDDDGYLQKDNVGAEVAPARAVLSSASDTDGAGPVAEEDLPDQVRSDVRPRTDNELEVLAGEAYASEETRAEAQQEHANAAAVVPEQLQQPSQGIQADVAEDEALAAEAAAAAAVAAAQETKAGKAAPSSVTTAVTEARRASARQESAAAAAVAPAPAPASSSSSPFVPPPAALGTTSVVITLEPMGCRTVLTLPVHQLHAESDGYRSTAPSTSPHGGNDTTNHWVMIAKDLFEAIASHLAVHPQSFHLFRNGERVRFMSTLFLDRDTASADAATRAEPLWLSVVFPPDEEDPVEAEVASGETTTNTSSSAPPHLASLAPGDVLVKCIYVRRSKPVILPSTLVENRQRHGLTFDQVIQAVNDDAGAQADPSLMAAVSVVHTAGGAGKPFIGGYRDVRDHSRVLHHASTQLFMPDLNYSPFPAKPVAVADLQSRQTQTWGTSRSCQTHRECCVQTPVTGVVIDTSRDIVVVARPYFSAADLLALRTEKAIVLQKLYRQWKARALRRELEDAEAEKQHRAEARQRAEEAAQLARDEIERLRRSDPRSANDFERLKEELEVWRAQESAYVRSDPNLSEEQKRAALLAITKQELKLLQELERHRRQAMLGNKERQFDHTMEKMASAKLWGQVEVTTRESERARELMELYRSLTQSAGATSTASPLTPTPPSAGPTSSARAASSTTDGGSAAATDAEGAAPMNRTTSRLDILLHVKWTVKEFDTELTRELCQLIDREADLLHRGRKEASVAGLRQRIALLFKQFIEDPAHNPGMAEYTRSAVGRLKARTLYGTVYNEDGSAVPGTTLVKSAANKKDATQKKGPSSTQYSSSRTR